MDRDAPAGPGGDRGLPRPMPASRSGSRRTRTCSRRSARSSRQNRSSGSWARPASWSKACGGRRKANSCFRSPVPSADYHVADAARQDDGTAVLDARRCAGVNSSALPVPLLGRARCVRRWDLAKAGHPSSSTASCGSGSSARRWPLDERDVYLRDGIASGPRRSASAKSLSPGTRIRQSSACSHRRHRHVAHASQAATEAGLDCVGQEPVCPASLRVSLNKHGSEATTPSFRQSGCLIAHRRHERRSPDDIEPDFHFTWSSRYFEHLGSIDRGLAFIKEQMKCLRRGGVAVHTTEFNVGSNHETIDHEATVLFRRRDLQRLARWLYSPRPSDPPRLSPGDPARRRPCRCRPFQLGPPSHGDPRLHDHLVRTHRPEGSVLIHVRHLLPRVGLRHTPHRARR